MGEISIRSLDEETEPLEFTLSFLQIKVLDHYLDLYFLSSKSIKSIQSFTSKFNVYILNPSYSGENPVEYQFSLARFGPETNRIQYFTIRSYYHQAFMQLFNYELRIVMTNIELIASDQSLYKMNVYFGKYADSQNQPKTEFSNYVPNNYQPPFGFPNYTTKIYEIKKVSSCSEEYKIDLITEENLNMNETEINLTFTGNSGSTISKCSISPLFNNKIVCQFEEDTINLNCILENYLDIGENGLLNIYMKANYTFPIKCFEKPPIRAMIGLSIIYLFIIIMIILFILFFNKAEKGKEYGYENPQNSKENNDLGLNPMEFSK